jgi:hypothetical protein
VCVNSQAVSDEQEPEEQAAADALAARLGGAVVPRDVCGAQGLYEFDLILPGQRRVAVEVTKATYEDGKRLMGAANRDYPAPGLSASWGVSLPKHPDLNVKAIMRALPPLLAVLEKRDVARAGRFDRPAD